MIIGMIVRKHPCPGGDHPEDEGGNLRRWMNRPARVEARFSSAKVVCAVCGFVENAAIVHLRAQDGEEAYVFLDMVEICEEEFNTWEEAAKIT